MTKPTIVATWRRLFWSNGAVTVVGIFVAACGFDGGSSPERTPSVGQTTITQRQADERVEQILRQTSAKLHPKPHLELFRPASQPYHCDDRENAGDDPRMVASRTYWLRDVAVEHNVSIGDQIKKIWEQQGYLITTAQGMGTDQPNLTGRTRPDDFLIALSAGDNGQLSIGATSPCVWPNGTPEPTS
jgi:hypothetical protein